MRLALAFTLVLAGSARAQNVGISATGALPDASAMLDVQAANRGLLVPRVALLGPADARTVPRPAPSLLVFNLNGALADGAGYYYNAGTAAAPRWLRLATVGTPAWSTRGNGGTGAESFLGTTDAQDLVVKTGGATLAHERLRVTADGQVRVGRPADVPAAEALAVEAAGPRTVALGARSAAATAPTVGARNAHGRGVAVRGVAGPHDPALPDGGAGGAFAAPRVGVAGQATGGAGEALRAGGTFGVAGAGAAAAVGAVVAGGEGPVRYALLGAGLVGQATGAGVAFAPAAPAPLVQDVGAARLDSGYAHVALDPGFAALLLVDDAHPLHVFVQAEGEAGPLYVATKTAGGFDVVEAFGGRSVAPFSYVVVGHRRPDAGAADPGRLPPAPAGLAPPVR